MNPHAGESYWDIVKRQFRKNKMAVLSLRVLYVLLFIGLFADFLANEKPIVCKLNDKWFFPIVRQYWVEWGLGAWPKEFQNADWLNMKYQFAVYPLVPYSPTTVDLTNGDYASPFGKQTVASWRWRHHLGTDQIGRDVLAGLIHGTRIAMLVGVVSMAIATAIGIFLGAMAGYFGDNRLQLSKARLILNALFVFFAWFYAFSVRSYLLELALSDSFGSFILQFFVSLFLFTAIMAIPNLLAWPLKKIPFLSQKITIPVDIIISRAIEIIISIPTLLLILSITAIVKKPSVMLIMVIIGLTGWTGIAKYIRAELLRIRSLEYIEAAQALGFSEWRIIVKHAIPNALTPVLIAVAFGVAGAILVESSLSFLGIGVQAEVITWGKLLSTARENSAAWWLAVFPGFAIFITVTIFNLLGEGLTDAMDPRLKQ
jgi:peptide/nickel transport system permease protein